MSAAGGHGIDVCACGEVIVQCRCMGPHIPRVVQQTCSKCRPGATVADPLHRPAAAPQRVGTQRIAVDLSAADLRRCVGAPPDALVEAVPVDHGPNGTTEARVVVSWGVLT